MSRLSIQNLNKLTNAQLLKLEKEKASELENEYQKRLKNELSNAIDCCISENQDDSIVTIKLNVLKNEYDIIEKVSTLILNDKVKKEVLDSNDDSTLTKTIYQNKYQKNYMQISDDLEGIFVKTLEERFRNLELREKLENEVKRENTQKEYQIIKNYMEKVYKEASGSAKNKMMTLGTEKLKKIIAKDLLLDYNDEYLNIYNKALKDLKNNYQDEIKIESMQNNKPDLKISTWWKVLAFQKAFESLFKI